MKKQTANGIVIVVLGIILLLILYVIFPVCTGMVETSAGKSIPMRCHWMSVAETTFAVILIAAGILAALARNRETRIMLYILTDVLGILIILTGTVLIGSCLSSTMVCSYSTKPAVVVFGIVLLVFASASILAELQKAKTEKETE